MPAISRLRVWEDTRLLGPPHSYHSEIETLGAGRYSHHGGALWFSTTDGSDPNENGRDYTLAIGRPTLSILGLGSCHVHAALRNLHARHLAFSLWSDAGVSYSLRETLQLVQFHLGKIELPPALRSLTLTTPPGSNTLPTLYQAADVIVIEISSFVDIHLDDLSLMRFRLINGLFAAIKARGTKEADLIDLWYRVGLMARNEATRRSSAEQLVSLFGSSDIDCGLAKIVLKGARSSRQERDAMVQTFRDIQQLLGNKPVVVLSGQNRFMPNGRAVRWPHNVAKELKQICQDLAVPLLHPADVVADYGITFSLEEDLVHYKPAFIAIMADLILDQITKLCRSDC
jgi:hypothetical protein